MKVRALQAVAPNEVELTEFPYPHVAEDAILLGNLYCGICGTDLHGIQGKRSVVFPIIPGHELVARVEEIGSRALETTKVFGGDGLEVGDLVSINPRIVCGKCYYCLQMPWRPGLCMGAHTYNSSIRSDAPPYLFGGWAEYIYILPHSEIIKLPEEIDLEVAALVEPLACAVSLLDRYRRDHDWVAGDAFAVDRCVVVFGAGAIGLLAASSFFLSGAKRVIVVDLIPEKLELARKFGAQMTIDASSTTREERVALVKEACDGLGPDVVVEACGAPATIGEGVEMLRRGGKLFELGHLVRTEPARVNPLLICRNEIEILGNYGYSSSNCLAYAARILVEGKLPYAELVRSFPLEDYQEVLFGDRASGVVKPVFKIA